MVKKFIGAGPFGCSYALVFLNFIQLAHPLFKYTNICGQPRFGSQLVPFSMQVMYNKKFDYQLAIPKITDEQLLKNVLQTFRLSTGAIFNASNVQQLLTV